MYSQEINFGCACNKVVINNVCKQCINMFFYIKYYVTDNILLVILISKINAQYLICADLLL
jgi:hypothetical protein